MNALESRIRFPPHDFVNRVGGMPFPQLETRFPSKKRLHKRLGNYRHLVRLFFQQMGRVSRSAF